MKYKFWYLVVVCLMCLAACQAKRKVTLSTACLKAEVSIPTGEIVFKDNFGSVLLKEIEGGGKKFRTDGLEGKNPNWVQQVFETPIEETFYGLGQPQYRGSIGKDVSPTHFQSVTDAPLLVSTKGYSILWGHKGTAGPDCRKEKLVFTTAGSERIAYYFTVGDNLDEVVRGHRTLTGKAPMVPKWVLGYWQSLEKYEGHVGLLDIVKKIRKQKTPVDNIVFDQPLCNPHPYNGGAGPENLPNLEGLDFSLSGVTYLDMGKRMGAFPGMTEEREFQILFISEENHGTLGGQGQFGHIVHYKGDDITIEL